LRDFVSLISEDNVVTILIQEWRLAIDTYEDEDYV